MSKEWEIGNQIARYDEQNKILYLILSENFEMSENIEFDELCKEVFKGMTSGRNVLIDMRNSGHFNKLTKEERNAFKDRIKSQNPTADKYAIIGASPSVRVFVKILLKFSGIRNSAFFKTENEAIQWFNT